MNVRLETLNHVQRAIFGRLLYRRPTLSRNVATLLMLEKILKGGK